MTVKRACATAANELWSMDFVSDALFGGRRLRALTVVESFNGRLCDECLNTHWAPAMAFAVFGRRQEQDRSVATGL